MRNGNCFYRVLCCGTAALIIVIATAAAASAQKTPQFRTRILEIPPQYAHAEAREIKLSNFGDLYAAGWTWNTTTGPRAPFFWNLTIKVANELPWTGFDSAIAQGLGAGDSNAGTGVGPGTGGQPHALYWPNTGSSPTDLHPAGYDYSYAMDASGGRQVGYGSASSSRTLRALLWNSSQANVVNLHPASGWTNSLALGMDVCQQVGWGTHKESHQDRALLWYGTAASAVDLHPTGYSSSYANGVSENGGMSEQVGWGGKAGSGTLHALLWRGSAASVVNLNPSGLGFFYSEAHGVSVGGEEPALVGQVGFGRGSGTHALYWRGTAASATDLHNFLSAEHESSYAYDISSTGDIVGTAVTNMGVSRPVLWERFVLKSLTLNSATIVGGQGTTGTVRINLKAPRGGAVVWLGPNGNLVKPSGISLPATVTIPEGATSATFPIISQFSFGGTRNVSVTATYSGFTQSAMLTINPTITPAGNP